MRRMEESRRRSHHRSRRRPRRPRRPRRSKGRAAWKNLGVGLTTSPHVTTHHHSSPHVTTGARIEESRRRSHHRSHHRSRRGCAEGQKPPKKLPQTLLTLPSASFLVHRSRKRNVWNLATCVCMTSEGVMRPIRCMTSEGVMRPIRRHPMVSLRAVANQMYAGSGREEQEEGRGPGQGRQQPWSPCSKAMRAMRAM